MHHEQTPRTIFRSLKSSAPIPRMEAWQDLTKLSDKFLDFVNSEISRLDAAGMQISSMQNKNASFAWFVYDYK